MKSLVDELLFISKERVRAEFVIGSKTVEGLHSFMLGFSKANFEAGQNDFRFKAFRQWLIDRGDMPQKGGWVGKMLHEAHDDSRAAMNLFLDRVEQFVREGG